MDTMELDKEIEVEENQIAFDFLQKIGDTQTLLKTENTEWISK